MAAIFLVEILVEALAPHRRVQAPQQPLLQVRVAPQAEARPLLHQVQVVVQPQLHHQPVLVARHQVLQLIPVLQVVVHLLARVLHHQHQAVLRVQVRLPQLRVLVLLVLRPRQVVLESM